MNCRYLAEGMLSLATPSTEKTFDFRFDATVTIVNSRPYGAHPFQIQLDNGMVDLSGLRDILQTVPMIAVGEADFVELLVFSGEPFNSFFLGVALIAFESRPTSLVVALFRQLVGHVVAILDKKHTHGGPVLTSRALQRVLSAAPSDPFAVEAFNKLCLDKSNRFQTTQELGRYQSAGVQEFRDQQFISFAGPDATKLTSKLAVSLAAVMNCSNGIVAIAAPKVNC